MSELETKMNGLIRAASYLLTEAIPSGNSMCLVYQCDVDALAEALDGLERPYHVEIT